MNKLIFTIFGITTALLFGCTNINQEQGHSVSTLDAIGQLETMCLDSRNRDLTFSLKEKTSVLKNDYEITYLGSVKTKNIHFDLLQKTALSGQEQDAQRANVSIMLFTNNKLYGEYTGLNKYYSVSVNFNFLYIYNKNTNHTTEFNLYDSIPARLFIPYTNADSIPSGDIFYFNKQADDGCRH